MLLRDLAWVQPSRPPIGSLRAYDMPCAAHRSAKDYRMLSSSFPFLAQGTNCVRTKIQRWGTRQRCNGLILHSSPSHATWPVFPAAIIAPSHATLLPALCGVSRGDPPSFRGALYPAPPAMRAATQVRRSIARSPGQPIKQHPTAKPCFRPAPAAGKALPFPAVRGGPPSPGRPTIQVAQGGAAVLTFPDTSVQPAP